MREWAADVLESGERLILKNATGTVIAAQPVRALHAFDPDFRTRSRGMQEIVVAQIDPDVGKSAAHGIEKNQIPRLEVTRFDLLSDLAHFTGSSRENYAEGVLEDQADKAAAIQTAFLIVAAEPVMDADQLQPFQDDFLSGAGVTGKGGQGFVNLVLFLCTGRKPAEDQGQGDQGGEKESSLHGAGM